MAALRPGVPVDAARMALAQQAVLLVGLRREDFSTALESVLISREQDRMVFRELFEAYFRNPQMAQKLLAQMLPSAATKAAPARRRPRVNEARAQVHAARAAAAPREDAQPQFDAAMTAGDLQRHYMKDACHEYPRSELSVRDAGPV